MLDPKTIMEILTALEQVLEAVSSSHNATFDRLTALEKLVTPEGMEPVAVANDLAGHLNKLKQLAATIGGAVHPAQ